LVIAQDDDDDPPLRQNTLLAKQQGAIMLSTSGSTTLWSNRAAAIQFLRLRVQTDQLQRLDQSADVRIHDGELEK